MHFWHQVQNSAELKKNNNNNNQCNEIIRIVRSYESIFSYMYTLIYLFLVDRQFCIQMGNQLRHTNICLRVSLQVDLSKV